MIDGLTSVPLFCSEQFPLIETAMRIKRRLYQSNQNKTHKKNKTERMNNKV